jgi:fructose-specific component phosphotransferase system IIB-like protein
VHGTVVCWAPLEQCLLKGLWRGGVERAIATPEVTLTDAVSLAAQDGELERERESAFEIPGCGGAEGRRR